MLNYQRVILVGWLDTYTATENSPNRPEATARLRSSSKMCCRTGIQKGSAGSVPRYSKAREATSKLSWEIQLVANPG